MPPPKATTKEKPQQQSQEQQNKKAVQFCKIVHKKNITPRATYKKDALFFPEDCIKTDPRLSFMEVTDPTLPEIEVLEIVQSSSKSKSKAATTRTPKKTILKPPTLPSKNLWADEIIPSSSSLDLLICPDVYHNFQEWLKKWKQYLVKLAKVAVAAKDEPPQKKKKSRRSSRRFSPDEKEDSDEEYMPELEKDMGSTFILAGPVGCGKTSMVYLFAKEIGFNVIEMSASDIRSAGLMNKKLQGAIEAFAVRGPGDIRSMFAGAGVQKRQTPGIEASSTTIGNNLILIDDADVVFKQDVNFWSKLSHFCKESKIPIILTCTNLRTVRENLGADVECRHFKFPKKESDMVCRYIMKWLKENHAETPIDKKVIKEIVADAKQDVRKAINNLQFKCGTLSSTKKAPAAVAAPAEETKFKLSPQDLAELDCVLTKCKEAERIPAKLQWNASILPNYDYEPDKDIEMSYEIPSVSNSNDLFIEELSNLIATSRPSSYADFDKRIQRQSSVFQKLSGRFAPMLPAIWDTIQRRASYRPLKTIALYELPALSSIHRSFQERMQGQISRRRVLHPFDEVNHDLNKALDRYGNLKNSIDEYNDWMGKENKEAL